jgi:ParB family chromosome partitioning protein
MSDSNLEPGGKKQRLGRGLGSLLGSSPLESQKQAILEGPQGSSNPTLSNGQASIPLEARLWQVAIDKIIPSSFQPRKEFDKDKLKELSDSIRQNGILQPIVARKTNSGKFEIIAGERRWRAAQMAGLHEVPVILKTLSNKETLELAIIENIQREDLNAVEEAEAYQRLMNEFNLTQQQVAEKVGKERATVANSLRLLMLSSPVRQLLIEGKITAGHAKILVSMENPTTQLKTAQKIVESQMSVRALEKYLQKSDEAQIAEMPTQADKLAQSLAEQLQKALGTKVSIDYKNAKGKISIHFYSDDELTEIAEKLKT